MSQMDLLVTNVADLLKAAVQEVLQLMGQAISEYQKETTRTRLENRTLRIKLKAIQNHMALVSDDALSKEHRETNLTDYEEKQKCDGLSDSLSFIEENSSSVALNKLPVEDRYHSLWTCDDSSKRPLVSSPTVSPTNFLRAPSPSSSGINEVTSKPSILNSNDIKVESKPDLLDCSVRENTDNVTTNRLAFSVPEEPVIHEHNQLPVSTSVVCHNQTHKSLNSTSVLSEHILRSRIENTVDIYNAPTVSGRRESSHGCHVCGKVFANSSSLGAHYVCHSNERPFVCKCCNFRFSRLADLKKHERIHTGERPYKCSLCGRKFNRTENLKRHLKKIHYGAVILD